jgi:cytosine/adenosine deaminase-related metal-dependent hydrolase
VGLDLHVDETVKGEDTLIDQLPQGAVERGLPGSLTVSHGCLLSRLSAERANIVIEGLADAKATVVALPATSLYFQDRREHRVVVA